MSKEAAIKGVAIAAEEMVTLCLIPGTSHRIQEHTGSGTGGFKITGRCRC